MKKIITLFLLFQFVSISSFSQDNNLPASKASDMVQEKYKGNNFSAKNSATSAAKESRFSAKSGEIIGNSSTMNQTNLISGNVSSVKSGLWSQAATWSTGAVPTADDNVTISNGTTVTIDVAAFANSLIVGQGSSGKLFYNNGVANTLTISKDLNIKAGAILSTPGNGASVNTNVLSLGGSLLNNGTLDLVPTGGTQSGALTFSGSGDVSYTGTGINNLALLNAAKNITSNIIEINVNNFTTGGLSTGATTGLITSDEGRGIIKFSGTNAYDGVLFSSADYIIAYKSGIWLNNPNFKINGQNGASSIQGFLQITEGTFNIGTVIDNSFSIIDHSKIIIEGGQVNTTGRFGVSNPKSQINYSQSGGVVTVSTIGNTKSDAGSFDLGSNENSTISITGGQIVVQVAATHRYNHVDYRNQAGNGRHDVTGGTLQLGNSLSGTIQNFYVVGIVPNIILTNISANHKAYWGPPYKYNNVALNVTVNNGTTMDFGSDIFLWAGKTFTNNGTIIHKGIQSRFVVYKGETAQTYTGTGIAGTIEEPIKTFELQSINGFTFAQSGPNMITTVFRIFDGMLKGTNKLTIGNADPKFAAVIQVGNSGDPGDVLGYDGTLNINEGTGGTALILLRTTKPWTIQKEIPPSQKLKALTIDNNDPSQITTLGTPGDLTITNINYSPRFYFTNGNLNLNGKNIRVGDALQPGELVYNDNQNYMFNGSYTQWIPSYTNSYVFPMGNSAYGKIVTVNFTTAPTVAGTLTASWSESSPDFPNASPLMEGSLKINRTSNQGSWFLKANEGLTGGDYTFSGLADGSSDVLDYTKTVLLKRPSAGGNWTLNGIHVTTTGSNIAPKLTRTGMSGFSEFAIGGEDNVALPVSLEYFHGNHQGMANMLNWKIGCTGSIQIVVQRSAETKNGYEDINMQNATALRCQDSFQYADNNPLQGNNFYRLKLTTIDGEVRYSNIVWIKNNQNGFGLLSINPNPVRSSAVLNAIFEKAGKISLKLTDNHGRVIINRSIMVTAGINNISLPAGNLAAGTYYLTSITEAGDRQTIKFVKY